MQLKLFSVLLSFRPILLVYVITDGLSGEQRQLQDEALKFAENELAPNMQQWDKKVLFSYRERCVSFHCKKRRPTDGS